MRIPVWLPPLLGFLTAVGPVSTDMYLPAFPAIEAAFGGRAGTAPVAVALATNGFIGANATVGALSRHPAHAGSASALMGTLMFALGATSGLLVGLASDGTARPMAVLMASGAALAFGADRARPVR